MSEATSNIAPKGSKLTVGQFAAVRITGSDGDVTDISGKITGIQIWTPGVIAIQFANIGEWVRLYENTELSDWAVRLEKKDKENN
jgi:hypothetical protein